MLGFVYAVIFARIIRLVNSERQFSARTMARLERVKTHTILCIEGVEVHIFMVYIYPVAYPAIHAVGTLSGLDLHGLYYH